MARVVTEGGTFTMRTLVRNTAIATVVLLAIISVGCGGSANPAAPTGLTGAPSASSGATIQGTVLGGLASARSADTTGGGLTVTVVGTNITATVGLTGQFTITGVPSGDITLKFHGNFGDANVQVSQVTNGQTITITITITGTTATTETEVRDDNQGNVQVEGRITSIDQTAGTMVVSNKTITTNSSTTIRHGGTSYTFADLQPGYRVHVAGTATTGGVLAKTIELQNDIATIQVNVNGTLDADATGTASAFQFAVGGRVVKGDSSTQFNGKGAFADLKKGARVEVKGQQQNGYVQATSIHVN